MQIPHQDQLIDLIRLMNEKPIAFNKHYVFLGCGINGAVMLSQLVYWADKSKDPNDWIYKTGKEWTEETGLTRREQDTARKNLRELGFIEEHKHGVPCKVHFRVNQTALYNALIGLAQKRQTDAQISQTECTNAPNLIGGIRQTNTESTAKNTADTIDMGVKKSKHPIMEKALIEKGADEQLIKDWILIRDKKKAVDSEKSVSMFLKQVENSGCDLNTVLNICTIKGWKGFESSYLRSVNVSDYKINKVNEDAPKKVYKEVESLW